jgi:hypothetical protein
MKKKVYEISDMDVKSITTGKSLMAYLQKQGQCDTQLYFEQIWLSVELMKKLKAKDEYTRQVLNAVHVSSKDGYVVEVSEYPMPLTHFRMLEELDCIFNPKQAGILSAEEVELVELVLRLNSRTSMDLRNLRDMAVMRSNLKLDHSMEQNENEFRREMDRVSGITAVIDRHIFSNGDEI